MSIFLPFKPHFPRFFPSMIEIAYLRRRYKNGLMIEKYLEKTTFGSMRDFLDNYRLHVPENFNFAYDVMDSWAEEAPESLALLWTDDKGECRRFTFSDMKDLSDRAASYYQTLGIGKGDMVMLILGRRFQEYRDLRHTRWP